MEELADLARQRRGSGDEIADPAAGPRPDAAEDEHVRDPELQPEPRRIRAPLEVVRVLALPKPSGPPEDALPNRGRLLDR